MTTNRKTTNVTETQRNSRGEECTVRIMAPNSREYLNEGPQAGHYYYSPVGQKYSRREAESIMRSSGMENHRIV